VTTWKEREVYRTETCIYIVLASCCLTEKIIIRRAYFASKGIMHRDRSNQSYIHMSIRELESESPCHGSQNIGPAEPQGLPSTLSVLVARGVQPSVREQESSSVDTGHSSIFIYWTSEGSHASSMIGAERVSYKVRRY
jgi:hypothetical protein